MSPEDSAPTIVVTTGSRPRPGDGARVDRVAERCGIAAVPRMGSLDRTLAESGADLLYVVWRDREELWSPHGRIGAHAALLTARLESGLDHPLLRAVAPHGSARRPVVDGTLGLVADALHLAAALEVRVVGCEASPVVLCLAEDGLRRLSRDPSPVGAAARRIETFAGDFATCLAALPDDAAEAVYISPMFQSPRGGVPGYDLFRRVAVHRPLGAHHVDQALRVAPRLVVKIGTSDPVPAFLHGHPVDRVASSSVHYLVVARP